MSLHTLTYTRDATTCLTLTGRTGEVFRSVADGRDGVVGSNRSGDSDLFPDLLWVYFLRVRMKPDFKFLTCLASFTSSLLVLLSEKPPCP